jgi:hypothetical protein
MPGKELIRTYFQKDHIEKAFRYLRGNACLAPVGYQLPNRVEAYLSVVNFISYELIAAILWNIDYCEIIRYFFEMPRRVSKIVHVNWRKLKSDRFYRIRNSKLKNIVTKIVEIQV